MTVNVGADKQAIVKRENPDSNFYTEVYSGEYYDAYINSDDLHAFFRVPLDDLATHQYEVIESIELTLLLSPNDTIDMDSALPFNVIAAPLFEAYDETSVTWNNSPLSGLYSNYTTKASLANYAYKEFTFNLNSNTVSGENAFHYILNYGVAITSLDSTGRVRVFVSPDQQHVWVGRPVFKINIRQFAPIAYVYPDATSPSSGFIAKNQEHTFSWRAALSSENTYTKVEQATGIFRWRYSSGGTVNEIPLTTETSVTLPASTFTEDEFEWQVSLTSNSGVTKNSDWFTLTTVESTSSASVVSPKNAVVNGAEPITFAWAHVISTGTEQTGADIQTSFDGENWNDLVHVSGGNTYYTAAANTFTAGALKWRVRTYNSYSVAGIWSQAVNIVVIAAPSAPIVSATDVPHTYITWRSDGQQAFRVMIDDFDTGSIFGVQKHYQFPNYLTDGPHIVKVQVQNQYGLWSDWGETAIQVENVSGRSITLYAFSRNDNVELSWQTSGDVDDYDGYVIYRDGKKIAKTSLMFFTDVFAATGEHKYWVRGVWDSAGYYGISSPVTVFATVSCVNIVNVESKQCLPIPHTVKSQSGQASSVRLNAKYVHYSSNRLPNGEIGTEITHIYQLLPVFLFNEDESRVKFESLIGKVVFIKDQYGTAMFGVLDSYQKTLNEYKSAYSTSITEINYSEEDANG